MAQLKLTAIQAATLRGLRTGTASETERKAAKKAVFADIKAGLGIPVGMKLKVEIDDTASPAYLVLKDKTTGHALLSEAGRYAGLDVPPPPAPAPEVAQAAPVDPVLGSGDRFTSAAPGGMFAIGRQALLELLRDAIGYANQAGDTPAGMPAVAQDGVVLDNQTGLLYFRA